MDFVPPSILTIREVILDSCRPLRRLDGRRENAAVLPPSLPRLSLRLLPVSIHSFQAAPRRRRRSGSRSFGVFLNA